MYVDMEIDGKRHTLMNLVQDGEHIDLWEPSGSTFVRVATFQGARVHALGARGVAIVVDGPNGQERLAQGYRAACACGSPLKSFVAPRRGEAAYDKLTGETTV